MPDDLEQAAIDTDVVVLFGATGDLAAEEDLPGHRLARAAGPTRACPSSAWRRRSGPTTTCGPGPRSRSPWPEASTRRGRRFATARLQKVVPGQILMLRTHRPIAAPGFMPRSFHALSMSFGSIPTMAMRCAEVILRTLALYFSATSAIFRRPAGSIIPPGMCGAMA